MSDTRCSAYAANTNLVEYQGMYSSRRKLTAIDLTLPRLVKSSAYSKR